jgi:hypothetical protein
MSLSSSSFLSRSSSSSLSLSREESTDAEIMENAPLTAMERLWSSFYLVLLKHGYVLRERYNPEWEPTDPPDIQISETDKPIVRVFAFVLIANNRFAQVLRSDRFEMLWMAYA